MGDFSALSGTETYKCVDEKIPDLQLSLVYELRAHSFLLARGVLPVLARGALPVLARGVLPAAITFALGFTTSV